MQGGCEGSTCRDNEACYPIGPTHKCKLIGEFKNVCLNLLICEIDILDQSFAAYMFIHLYV